MFNVINKSITDVDETKHEAQSSRMYEVFRLSHNRDTVLLFSDLQDDGADGDICIKVQALEPDLMGLSRQYRYGGEE